MMKIKIGEFQTWVDLVGETLPKGFGGMAPPVEGR
jgi:hypothetical protein